MQEPMQAAPIPRLLVDAKTPKLQLNGFLKRKAKKKAGEAGGARMWFDWFGQSELIECNKSTIIKRLSILDRDLRILGPSSLTPPIAWTIFAKYMPQKERDAIIKEFRDGDTCDLITTDVWARWLDAQGLDVQ
ncbi:hypothetical protein RHMOL_Rhmol07G0172800 [Rhododendron molle]|uniref:Uncharacterized protein n=4 Tax=Rhododendron molle TaxID=49168 RepID=A0ACC0N1X0_RHOML|nr:hypothetical protein RHMOL_Rhmol07G0172800 [Rhododendron molle]KAI8547150.1 hypothetical protein RHMOL_Rhmol07G0172800 [Rhododendron molle]KAI8547151.1 hypothetical protein RHMOL_Rhmol07G0172800 [Rhododendron molle]KAI8547152.1 hypothetical protein RHMOL_Rhmol07G0172800 [Rhododendron molle]